MDAFQSPDSSDPSEPTGDFDLGHTIAVGVGTVIANLLPMMLVLFVSGAALLVSACTIVGWIAVVPIVSWGIYAFMLKAIDGPADVSAAVSGLDDFGRCFSSMWGLALLLFLLYMPAGVVGAALTMPSIMAALEGASIDPVQTTMASNVPLFLWGLVLVRFLFVPFLIVERKEGVIDAFGVSWAASRPHWVKLIALHVIVTLLNLPGLVLNVGSQLIGADIDPMNVEAQLAALPTQLGLALGGMVVTTVASLLSLAFFASAYRQVFGEADSARIP